MQGSSSDLGIVPVVQKRDTDSAGPDSVSQAAEKTRTSPHKKNTVSSPLGANTGRSPKRKATEEICTTPRKKIASSPSDAFEHDSIEEISAYVMSLLIACFPLSFRQF